ncbi:rho GTPase-activating protein 100F isoform X7 [Bombus vosnesenskii]|uniref:Rho GTPase-activating protein 100F isoform X7 n=2 Tax=Pyrobombus TaxID=144703 RepID=A0A6J3LIA5_9HYME|nr:rho GTPase-activating protein 100F isoform X7 [Bombus vancouverensis nearcticus]XP_033320162.1 rho GTPase-activating protein 100F isoform X7 [Bombus bifarius]XP_033365112.1 rho GTPase-activating protein 100F isoform X7 [Bombus vosnesenskii]XP_050492771.1 rho GTPase-activating protein 100F isoform X7 [Bombus huntii]
MDKRTIPRTTDLDTSRRRKEEQQRAWTPVETRERGAEGCTTKAEELLAAAAGLPEDTSNKRGCKSAAQVWMSLLSLCDRMCGSAAWLVLFTCLHGEGRGEVTDISASPGRQAPANQLRPKEPPPMVIQGDFRKVSGISTEIFKQIETVENDHDASTAAALEAVERRGEMVVRVIEPRQMGRQASEAAKKFIAMQDPKHPIHFVEIIKRPGQTLGLYIREGNGVDRNDGVFISRIALETAVYNSGCLKVGDEILAVNLVDVTHMSLDDVVIIMSIPRRLVLATRHGQHQPVSHSRQTEHKAPPVVVIKRELNEDESDHATSNHVRDGSRRRGDGREMLPSRSRLGLSGLGSSQDLGSSNGDLYYNSRPEGHWSYQPPPPPVITHQPKPSTTQHFQPYERGYPKTLESLAEKDFTKVHSFYTGPVMPSNGGRRMSTGAGMQSVGSRLSSQTQPSHYGYGQHSGSGRIMPRSGSDQHLPRVDYTSITTPARHTLLRSSLKSGTSALRYNTRYGTQGDSTSTTQRQGQFGTLTRRHRPSLDYASDTEATCSSSPKSAYYYYRHNMNNPPQSSAVSHLATLSRSQIGQSSSGLRSNSLPRSGRTLPQQPGLRSGLSTVASGLIDQEDSDGALSAPELPSIRRDRGRIPSSPSVFTSDEYRAWLSRTPSTSALYEQIRATTTRPPRYTYSAENIHAAVNQGEYGSYGTYRPLSSTLDRLSTRSASAQQVNLANLRASTAISSTCHRGTANPRPASVASSARTSLTSQKPSLSSSTTQRATSVRRIRNLLDLESTRSIPTPTPTRTQDQRLLDINPAEFLKYKIEKPPTVGTPSSTSSLLSSLGETSSGDLAGGVSGLLWVHLLAGRGLRSTTSSSAATTPSTPSGQPNLASCGLRDLYCVLECDRVHKARTVMRTGDLMFDWDETFELDLVGNRQLDLLVYSWDPQYRHKLCYKGSVHLATLLKESPVHQLAVKVEPRGTIYLRLRYTDAQQTFRRRGLPVISLATRVAPLFGVDLDTVVSRESKTGGVPGGVSTALAMGVPNVPIIVWRCVEEVERRGLDIIGLYRLCGSATKKRILREAFERNARSVNLSPDNVPDINVITGVLKDYLRELPEPLFTRCLYQMMVDALAVCLPDDPQGNAKLMFSILDCLPKVNRCTLIYLLDHLAMVVSQCNKMSPASLAVCFGPVLMLHSEENGPPLDFQQPIAVLKYLLEIWPVKSDSSEDFFSRFGASSSYANSRAQQQSTATAAPAAGSATGATATAGNIGTHRAALAASTLTSSTAPNYGSTRSPRALHSSSTTGQASPEQTQIAGSTKPLTAQRRRFLHR